MWSRDPSWEPRFAVLLLQRGWCRSLERQVCQCHWLFKRLRGGTEPLVPLCWETDKSAQSGLAPAHPASEWAYHSEQQESRELPLMLLQEVPSRCSTWHCMDVLAADSVSNTRHKHLQWKEHQLWRRSQNVIFWERKRKRNLPEIISPSINFHFFF